MNLATSSSLRGIAWTLGTGYAVQTGQSVMLDVFGGLRYFELEVSTDWQLANAITGPGGGQTFPRTGEISEKVALWDGIVGVKGRIPLGSSDWSIPYYLERRRGFVEPDMAGDVRRRLLVHVGRGDTCLPYPLLRPEGRQAYSGPALQRPGARPDVSLLIPLSGGKTLFAQNSARMRMNGPEETPCTDLFNGGYRTSAVHGHGLEPKARGSTEYKDSDLNEDTDAVRNEAQKEDQKR